MITAEDLEESENEAFRNSNLRSEENADLPPNLDLFLPGNATGHGGEGGRMKEKRAMIGTPTPEP